MNERKHNLERQTDVLISVIVPVYNCEDSLKLTVDSLLNQTYKDIEIILVDDGSKDSSGNLCEQLSASDQGIKQYVKQTKELLQQETKALKSHKENIFHLLMPETMLSKTYMSH